MCLTCQRLPSTLVCHCQQPLAEAATCCSPFCRDTLSTVELERYERQHQHIQDICHLYETDPNNFTRLVDLLQQVGMGG